MKLKWRDIGQIVAVSDDGEDEKVVADVFDVVGEQLVTRYNFHDALLAFVERYASKCINCGGYGYVYDGEAITGRGPDDVLPNRISCVECEDIRAALKSVEQPQPFTSDASERPGPVTDAPEQIGLAIANGNTVAGFIGWLSADIPELRCVGVPRLGESYDRFLRRLASAVRP